MFREWVWQLEQYLLAVDASFGPELKGVHGNLDTKYCLVLEMSAEKSSESNISVWFACVFVERTPVNDAQKC